MSFGISNKRKDLRQPVTGRLPGKLVGEENSELLHVLVDVSKYGLGIISESPISKGEIITLNLEGTSESPIRLQVKWTMPVTLPGRNEPATRCGLLMLNRFVDLERMLQRFDTVQFEGSTPLQTLIHSKLARILVLESAINLRHEVVGAIKDLGFADVSLGVSIADAKQHLQAGTVDWILTGTFFEANDNVIELLNFMAKNQAYTRTLVSCFVNDMESEFVPALFERGVLSVHNKGMNRKTICQHFAKLLLDFSNNDWDARFTAAACLREYLVRERNASALLSLEESLLNTNQENTSQLLRLAQAHFAARNNEQGEKLLFQAKVLNPSLERDANDILKKVNANSGVPTNLEIKKKGFGFASCVVIDPDEGVLNSLSSVLFEMGATNVMRFSDGEKAWAWLSTHAEPDLIIFEWKIPKVSGLSLVQRVRNHGFQNVSMVVLSSLLRGDDIPLVSEMSVAAVILKPYNRRELSLTLRWVIGQSANPTEQKSIERRILSCLANKEIDEAKTFTNRYQMMKGISDCRKKYIQAEICYHTGDIDLAKQLVIESIRDSDGEPLAALNLLGKCLMKLGDFNAALKFFEKAQSFSPKNIQRQCEIAEARLAQNDLEGAVKGIQQARELDATFPSVAKVENRIATGDVELEDMRDLLKKLGPLSPIVSFMNNRAIAYVRTFKFNEGLTLYRDVLELISNKDVDTLSIVSYNLALGYVRASRLPEALNVLKVTKPNDKQLTRKVHSLHGRVQRAIEKGEPLVLAGPKNDADELDFESFGNVSHSVKIDTSFVIPVRMCLLGIYRHPHPYPQPVRQLLERFS